MASISALRSGLATNLLTANVRSSATLPELVNPPFALIVPAGITYHRAFNNALSEYNFTVTLVVGRADARTAQNALDEYCSASGTSSIRRAIESDKTLGGVAYAVVVTDMRNYGATTIGETTYLAAEFNVVVQAD
jgi:hypothetical protein